MEYTVGQVLSEDEVKALDLTTIQFCGGPMPFHLAVETTELGPRDPVVWSRDIKAAAGYGIVSMEVVAFHGPRMEVKVNAIRDFRIGKATIHRGDTFGATVGNQAVVSN